jgi:hypothetical protein
MWADRVSRPRLSIGTFGARTRYRDWDGRTPLVEATGETRRTAEHALKGELAERSHSEQSSSALTPDSAFGDLVAYWLSDLDAEGRISRTTRLLYERNMRTLVLPAFGNLTLREIGVARCDSLIKHLAKQSYSRAKQARVALHLALGRAVRHEVIPRNPMDHVSRLDRPAHTPDAPTPTEVNAIRIALLNAHIRVSALLRAYPTRPCRISRSRHQRPSPLE